MRDYLASIIRLPFSVKWFLLTEFIFGFSVGIWNLNFNFHLKENGFTDLGIGSVLAFGAIITAIVSLAAGQFGDRLGFKPAMVFGCIVKGIGMTLMVISPGIQLVYIGQVLFSLGDAFILSSEFPFIMSLVGEDSKTLVYNLLICAFLFAMFLGNLAGGYIPGWMPKASSGYVVSLFLSGMMFIVLGLGRILLPGRATQVKPKNKLLFYLLKDIKILWFVLYGISASTVFGMFSSMINIVYRDYFHLADATVGMVFSITTFISFIGVFFLPLIARRWQGSHAVAAILLVMAFAPLGMSFVGVQLFILLWIVYSFLRILLPGTVDSPMLQAVPEEIRGSYSGIRIFANNIGISIGAAISGTVLTVSSYAFLMLLGAGMVVVQLLVYWLGCRRYLWRQDTGAAISQ